jgi:hypothetical protein
MFMTKFSILPHLRAIICGTGFASVYINWVSFIQSKLVAQDVLFLDSIAPTWLPEIARDLDLPSDGSTTIYHFGYVNKMNRFMGYAYRSKNGYCSEQLQDGFGIKPADGNLQSTLVSIVEEKGVEQGFVDATKVLRDSDNRLPAEERIGIGGEVHFAFMDRYRFDLRISYRFEDYDSLYNAMLKNLQ